MSRNEPVSDAVLDNLLREASSGRADARSGAPLGARDRASRAVAWSASDARRQRRVVLIAACLPLVAPRPSGSRRRSSPQPPPHQPTSRRPTTRRWRPVAVFTPSDDHIVVSCERVAEDVTVVQLLPTVRSEKSQRRRALAQYFQDQVKRRGGSS